MKILSTAQSFGYGPSSKLYVFLKNFTKIYPNCEIDFFGENIAFSFAQRNSIYEKLIYNKGNYDLVSNYNTVISVMEPVVAIIGKFLGKKVIYVDSLFWFRKWDQDKFQDIRRYVSNIEKAHTKEEILRIINDIDPHYLQYLGHYFSDISYIQEYTLLNKKDIFRTSLNNLINIGPIIDGTHKKAVDKDTILITLSGFFSPLNGIEEGKNYFKLISYILKDFIEEHKFNYNIIFALNEELKNEIGDTIEGVKIVSLSHQEMLETINKSVVVFSPAGITTIYESLYYDTPIFILPEQHDGHYDNYKKLGNNIENIESIETVFPGVLLSSFFKIPNNISPEDKINYIKNLIRNLVVFEGVEIMAIKKYLNKFNDIFKSKENMKSLLISQKKCFKFNLNTESVIKQSLKIYNLKELTNPFTIVVQSFILGFIYLMFSGPI